LLLSILFPISFSSFPHPGAGIDELMNEMAKLALESQKEILKPVSHDSTGASKWLKRNEELDVHQRYAAKNGCLIPFHWCCEETHDDHV
jgi:hypothetical protein